MPDVSEWHLSVLIEVHDVVPQVVSPICAVGVILPCVKSRPRRVMVWPTDVGWLYGNDWDRTGESKVKIRRAVPTIALTVTLLACVDGVVDGGVRKLVPSGLMHCTSVPDDHAVVKQ